MNASKALAAEFMIAIAFASWAAAKHNYWPWPPTLVKIGISFSLLGGVAFISEELAVMLGAGFLVAAFMKVYQPADGHKYKGIPESAIDNGYALLTLGTSQPA